MAMIGAEVLRMRRFGRRDRHQRDERFPSAARSKFRMIRPSFVIIHPLRYTSRPDSSPAEAAPVQPPPDRGASAQRPPTTTRRSVNPAALAPAASTAPAPPAPAPTLEQQLQQRAAERQMRAQKATDCRQQAVKDHPLGGVAMAQEYTS